METSHNARPEGARPSYSFTASLSMALICLMVMVLGTGKASAQSNTDSDIKNLGFSISVPDVVLMEGETVEAVLSVGSENAPVRSALGFEIWVELSADGLLVPSLTPDMDGSWMEGTVSPSESRTGLATARYTYRFLRSTAVDGGGMVLKLQLKAAKDNISAQTIVSRAGGLMQIDNLELRMAAPTASAAPAVEVWPNPAVADAGMVQVRCAGQAPLSVSLWSLNGQQLGNFDPTQPLDTHMFAAGTYILQVGDASGKTHHQKLILQ